MKRILLLALTLSLVPSVAHASAGKVVGCQTIRIANSAVKGISLPCLDNNSRITFQAIRGPAVVNVFGSWCEPCNQEIPHFLQLQALHKVALVGIDVEETSMKAGRNFVVKKGVTWPILYDTASVTRGLFGPGVPVTWFIDAQGKVVYKQIGVITSTAELKAEITKYLKIKL
jgi:thiol-disulfide isomerase/thioredoxin